MEAIGVILGQISSLPILFFALGVFAGLVKNDAERRHSGVGYVPPVEYLRGRGLPAGFAVQAGIRPRVLVETGPRSSSASGGVDPSDKEV